MNILLFLLLSKFYWIESSTGLVYAEFDKPIKEHSKFICVEGKLDNSWKYKWDGKTFVEKPAMKVSVIKDSIKVEADSPIETELMFQQKVDISVPPNIEALTPVKIDAKTQKTITTSKSFIVDMVAVTNIMCYPSKIYIKVVKK